jgi:hypothetical protein
MSENSLRALLLSLAANLFAAVVGFALLVDLDAGDPAYPAIGASALTLAGGLLLICAVRYWRVGLAICCGVLCSWVVLFGYAMVTTSLALVLGS